MSLLKTADEYAQRVDNFLIEREQSVISKLIAIGGVAEGESYEVQIKVPVEDPDAVVKLINQPDLTVVYHRHYHEYDTYFVFNDPKQGLVRHREDEFIDRKGQRGARTRPPDARRPGARGDASPARWCSRAAASWRPPHKRCASCVSTSNPTTSYSLRRTACAGW